MGSIMGSINSGLIWVVYFSLLVMVPTGAIFVIRLQKAGYQKVLAQTVTCALETMLGYLVTSLVMGFLLGNWTYALLIFLPVSGIASPVIGWFIWAVYFYVKRNSNFYKEVNRRKPLHLVSFLAGSLSAIIGIGIWIIVLALFGNK
jgi:hypothetical protein